MATSASFEASKTALDGVFMDSESEDEFEGWAEEEVEEAEEEFARREVAEIEEKTWVQGDRVPQPPQFLPPNAGEINLGDIDNPEILDFFKLFVNEDVIENMTTQTNIYAQQFLAQTTLKRQSRFHDWSDLTPDDMKSFLALIIAMGLVHQLDIQDYWTTCEVNSTPFFGSVMSRNKFLLILSMFHLNDNTKAIAKGTPGFDQLFKVRPLYDSLLNAFKTKYTPRENVALDEATVGWRGNLSFKVYNPDKPVKFGMKIYEICDSSNAYCYNFEMYTGKQQEISEKGATYDVVWRLMQPLIHKGYKLYVDNYYTSPELFQDLYDHETGACGTLRKNRKGVPSLIKGNQKLKRGEAIIMNNGDLLAMKWKDKRDVHMLTTIHDGSFKATGKTDRTTNEAIVKPAAILEYNKHMGGVDRSDQMLQYTAFNRKTLKWWKKACFHLFDLAVLNSYILYVEYTKASGEVPDLQRVFRRKVVQQLLLDRAEHAVPINTRHIPTAENVIRLTARHHPDYIPATKKKTHTQRICVVCSPSQGKRKVTGEKTKRKETRYECIVCDVGLCAAPCFRLYHTTQDYKAAHARWVDEQQRLKEVREAEAAT